MLSKHQEQLARPIRPSLVPRLHSPAFYRTVYKSFYTGRDKKLGSGVWERGYTCPTWRYLDYYHHWSYDIQLATSEHKTVTPYIVT